MTRLRVSGFKNLADADVRFGPFTCIAGVNAVGKSNLFDAILFLGALADRPLLDAALSVRDEAGRHSDIGDLFLRYGNDQMRTMSFEVEMIVSSAGIDDLGQRVGASSTFLRYGLTLAYRESSGPISFGELEIEQESLTRVRRADAAEHLGFAHSPKWRSSVIRSTPGRQSPYISTELVNDQRKIHLHQEGRQGRPLSRLASELKRTVLSNSTAAEHPTALLARREMQSWRLLRLDPAAIREPDAFRSPTAIGADGSHVASTLFHLAYGTKPLFSGESQEDHAARVFATVANRLSELIDDVREVSVDRDEQRQLLTLRVTDRRGTAHPARSLSDGTLRFLALSVLDMEIAQAGLICLEEPENGIHPERIPAMLRLLQHIAADVDMPADEDNPVRQVIINTHSPSVVSFVPADALVLAETTDVIQHGKRYRAARFSALPDTWRVQMPSDSRLLAKGNLLAYLNPVNPIPDDRQGRQDHTRVVDREDLRSLFRVGAAPE